MWRGAIIKMALTELMLEGVDAGWGAIMGYCEYDNGYISSTTGGEFLDKPLASESEIRQLNFSVLVSHLNHVCVHD
jgi:hypothetical protein